MPLPIYTTSTNQGAPLGDELVVPTNRVYRYARNGSASLVAGTVLQAARPETSHDNLTCAAAAVGATSITVTLGSARADIDQYKQGYVFINDVDGQGYIYDIRSHPWAAAQATLALQLKDQVAVALTTSSQATLIQNVYDGVSRPAGNPWDIIAGVAPITVAANEYFWCQVRGPAAVLQEGALFAGRGVMLSSVQPGAVAVAKQIIPAVADARSQRVGAGADIGPAQASATVQYTQKGLHRRYTQSASVDEEELLVNVSGKATIPERVLGYCINPRVSEEFALVYLTIS